jgi:hypothetical protein
MGYGSDTYEEAIPPKSGSLHDTSGKQYCQQCASITSYPDIPAYSANRDNCEDTNSETSMATDDVDEDSELQTSGSCSGDPALEISMTADDADKDTSGTEQPSSPIQHKESKNPRKMNQGSSKLW